MYNVKNITNNTRLLIWWTWLEHLLKRVIALAYYILNSLSVVYMGVSIAGAANSNGRLLCVVVNVCGLPLWLNLNYRTSVQLLFFLCVIISRNLPWMFDPIILLHTQKNPSENPQWMFPKAFFEGCCKINFWRMFLECSLKVTWKNNL